MYDNKSRYQPVNSQEDRMDKYIKEYGVEDQFEELNNIKMDEKGIVNKLKDFDPDEKNEEIIKKASIMGEILNRISDDIQEEQLTNIEKYKVESIDGSNEESMRLFDVLDERKKPVAGRIYREEMSRLFYLNNKDPSTYNVAFFAEYFGIDIKKMRALVNSMSYPIVNIKTGEIDITYRFYDNIN